MCIFIRNLIYLCLYVYICSAPRHVLPRALLAPGLLYVELVAQIVVVD